MALSLTSIPVELLINIYFALHTRDDAIHLQRSCKKTRTTFLLVRQQLYRHLGCPYMYHIRKLLKTRTFPYPLFNTCEWIDKLSRHNVNLPFIESNYLRRDTFLQRSGDICVGFYNDNSSVFEITFGISGIPSWKITIPSWKITIQPKSFEYIFPESQCGLPLISMYYHEVTVRYNLVPNRRIRPGDLDNVYPVFAYGHAKWRMDLSTKKVAVKIGKNTYLVIKDKQVHLSTEIPRQSVIVID